MGSIKTFEKDEIKMEFDISDNGFLERININIKDTEFFNSIPNEKKERDRVCTQLFNTINQILNNVKAVQKERLILDNINRDCPNPECKNTLFKLVQPCCDEKKAMAMEGKVMVLACNSCGQRIWINREEYHKITEK
jgi:hypothetical protein